MSIPKKSAGTGKIYLGSSIIAEGGCGGWTPGSNTVLYCPFDTDMINKVDGSSPTRQSGASISNGYLSVSDGYVEYTAPKNVGGGVPFTFNTRLYMYSINTWNRRVITHQGGGYFMDLRITGYQRQSYQSIPLRTIMSQGDDNARRRTNGFRIPLNEWHNICIIFDGTKVIQYYDTQKLEIGISIDRDTSAQTNLLSIGANNSYDKFDGRQSNLIIENGNRSENLIISYYNQTKSAYGL